MGPLQRTEKALQFTCARIISSFFVIDSSDVNNVVPQFLVTDLVKHRLEFITNLMHGFIYSIIILHHDPQHVSSITVLIFGRTIVYLQYLVSSHSVWQHTECDDTRYCKNTVVLLKMSTAMLETC
jgi:hypothetical protein